MNDILKCKTIAYLETMHVILEILDLETTDSDKVDRIQFALNAMHECVTTIDNLTGGE